MASVLTPDQVCLARKRAARGDSIHQIALDLGVKERAVGYAVRGTTYGSITDPAPVSMREQSAAAVESRYPELARCFYEGQTYAAIAAVTGLTPSCVRTLCLRLNAYRPRRLD